MSNTADSLQECELCAAPAPSLLLYEDDRVYAMLHADRAVAGHAMLVARAHVENLSDLPVDDALHFTRIHHALERALLAATGSDRMILLKLGLKTPHLHLHLYPVSKSADRAAVMRAIDAASRWNGSDADEQEIVGAVRASLGLRPER